MNEKIIADGIADFSGGMDSNTSPSLLQKNQYFCSVNMQMRVGKRGISTRSGYREVKLNFATKKQEAFYRSSIIQGCGYYLYGSFIVQMVSCSGRIFELREVNKWEYDVVYTGIRNNENIRNVYFPNVPDGLIINDGEAAPIYGQKLSYRRSKRNEIGAGYGGTYTQNRFFFVKPNRTDVGFSSFNNPMSLEEPTLANLVGFRIPDNNNISALGEQRFLSKTSQGGSLVISSLKNIYSVDVRGPISGWGKTQDGIGTVSGDIYDIGAQSQNSFISLNGNVYFRSRNLGLVSLQYLQFIFNNQDILENQSYGGDLFFDNDDKFLLDSCHTVKYKNKLYTTVSPDMNMTGVFWNGLLVSTPQQKGIITYESLHTGIRPWCMCQPDDSYGEEFLYFHSYDCDGVNRMYILDETADMDHVIGKPPKEIESKLFTRMMSFDNGFSLKKQLNQIYSVSGMSRDIRVKVLTRNSEDSSFKMVFDTVHKTDKCSIDSKGIFVNENLAQGDRSSISFSDSSGAFLFKQDLIKILGSCNVESILRQCVLSSPDTSAHTQERNAKRETYCPEGFFSYKTVG
jgi:hypothetical protein